jgi:HEAT repeat protein
MLLLLTSAMLAGCGDAPATAPDLAKTPWLDPKLQIQGLTHEDFRIRGLAAHHLGNIGASAADAVPMLEKLARDDPDAKVRENAAKALEKIRAAQGPGAAN